MKHYRIRASVLTVAGLLFFSAASVSAQAPGAKATLKTADGKDVGSVTFTQTPHGVLLALALKGLSPGEHAFHVHTVGKCEPPFESAGEHFNPGNKKHGMHAPEGLHAGDMPNLHVPQSGELTIEVLNAAITLDKGTPSSVFKPDGTAVIIHTGRDDYKSDPSGDAGGRLACGVIQ